LFGENPDPETTKTLACPEPELLTEIAGLTGGGGGGGELTVKVEEEAGPSPVLLEAGPSPAGLRRVAATPFR